jgi:hypothetical protein
MQKSVAIMARTVQDYYINKHDLIHSCDFWLTYLKQQAPKESVAQQHTWSQVCQFKTAMAFRVTTRKKMCQRDQRVNRT